MQGSQFKALWDFIFLSGGELLGKIAGLLAFAYLARVLGPTAYGSVEVALAMLGIFTLFVQFGFGPIGAREVSRNSDNIEKYSKLIPGSRLLLALICIPGMWLIASQMGKSPQTIDLIFITSFALLAAVWNQGWLFQGMEKMRLVSLNQSLKMLFYLVAVLFLVNSAEDLITVGYIEIASGVVTVIYFLVLQRREKIRIAISFNLAETVVLMKRAFAVGSSNIVWALNQYLPTLLLAYLIGGATTAWLGAAHRIVNAIITFSMVYHFNLFPAVSHRLQHSKKAFAEIVGPSFRVTAWGGIAIALTISLLAETITVVVFGADFSDAALPMSILIWSLPLTLLNGHARWALIAKDKQRFVLFAQLAGTATTLVAGLTLIPQYGPVGGAITMVLCSAVVWFVAHVYAVKWVAPIPSLDYVWRPLLLAIFIISIVNHMLQPSLVSSIIGIIIFAMIAPLLDRNLIQDIKSLSQIKNDNSFESES